jgi:hypothetical protein
MLRAAGRGADTRQLVMTLQGISGSDYFHPVHSSTSSDRGASWTEPALVPALGRVPAPGGTEEGVCDVLPEYHPQTNTVLAIGHTVFYRDGRLFDTMGDWHAEEGGLRLQRKPAYVICDAAGRWSAERRTIAFAPFEDCSIYSCGSSQRVTLADGSLIIPFTFGFFDRRDRMVCTVRCGYDGTTITPEAQGNALELPVNRGLLEPSVTAYDGRYYLTIRAEDNRGHWAVSDDGLQWGELTHWAWDDGEALTMSTTQQHWLVLGGKLYLVYTRQAEDNTNVPRWRSPLVTAEVDVGGRCLKRATEQVIFPLSADGVTCPDDVAMMGNFNILPLDERTAIAHVGEMLPKHGFTGDSLQALLTV